MGPSQPIKVIVAKGLCKEEKSKTSGNPEKTCKLNGETNLHFEGDEVTFRPTETSSHPDITDGNPSTTIPANGHGHSSSCNGDCPHTNSSIGSPSSSGLDIELTKAYYEFLSTVYIQLAKDKQVRVIHIKPNPNKGDQLSRKKSSEASSSIKTERIEDERNSNNSSSSDDEEYWFTRWSRRPKIKNVFKPKPETKPENAKPKLEVVVELNSKFKYEDIEDDRDSKDRVSLNGFRRQSSNASIVSTNSRHSQQQQQPPPSTSQNDANFVNAKSSGSFSRSASSDDIERNQVASDRVSLSSSNTNRNSQQELVVRGDNESHDSANPYSHHDSGSAFTNFAFQSDPEDEEDIVDENPEPDSPNENHKTDLEDSSESSTNHHFETDIHAKSERAGRHLESTDLSQLKLNGGLVERSGSFHSINSCQLVDSSKPTSCDKENNDTDAKEPDRSKPILFFIHGISGSSETWKSQFEYFHDNGYEIIAPDLLGHGLSSTPNTPKYYLFESLVQDLTFVHDQFITEERKTIIIGHGYG